MKKYFFVIKIFSFLVVLLLSGCNSPIQSIVHKNIAFSGNKVEIKQADPLSFSLLKKALNELDIKIEESDFKIVVENRLYENSCNNALIKSTSNTQFDGMLLLELHKNNEKLKSVFMDYRGSVGVKEFKSLLKKLLS